MTLRCRIIASLAIGLMAAIHLLAGDDAPKPAAPKRLSIYLGGAMVGGGEDVSSGPSATFAYDFFQMKYIGLRGRIGYHAFGSKTHDDRWLGSPNNIATVKQHNISFMADLMLWGSGKDLYVFFGMGKCQDNVDVRYGPNIPYIDQRSGKTEAFSFGLGYYFSNDLCFDLNFMGTWSKENLIGGHNFGVDGWTQVSIGYRF